MKRTTMFIMAIALFISFTVHSSAIESEINIITINNVDVIFDANSSLTEEAKQHIAEYLVCGASNMQTYGLICNLFGHKNTTEIVTTITHCVRDTVPRCLDEEWEITTCSRCDNVETTRIAYSYRNCCPEE